LVTEQHGRRLTEILAFLTIHDGNRATGRERRFEILRRRERDIGLLELRLGKAGGREQ
jgi:hypothetical protein